MGNLFSATFEPLMKPLSQLVLEIWQFSENGGIAMETARRTL